MSSMARKITIFTRSRIELFFKKAKKVFWNPAFILLKDNASQDFGRILIVASRKVGNAPERNKIRRRIKSIFYEEKLYELPFDWAIIIKRPATTLSFEELKKLFLEGIKK